MNFEKKSFLIELLAPHGLLSNISPSIMSDEIIENRQSLPVAVSSSLSVYSAIQLRVGKAGSM